MGNKVNIQLEDLEVNKEYWVQNGHWSFRVISTQFDGVYINTVSGKMFLSFSDERDKFIIEEY